MATIPNVSDNDLILTDWGNLVATELNDRSVKVNGAIGDGTTPPNQWMTGSLIINASPALKLRRSDDLPTIQFETNAGARISYVQAAANSIVYNIDANTAATIHSFRIANVEHLHVDNAGVDITGALTVSTTLTSSGLLSANSGGRFGGNGNQVQVVDTSTALTTDEFDCYVGFYGQANSMTDLGALSGYVGFNASSTFHVTNAVTNGAVTINANGSGTLGLTTGVSGDISMVTGAGGNILINASGVITFDSGGVERGRVAGSLMWGKSVGGIANIGVELFEGGTIYSTTQNNGAPNILLRHKTDASLSAYVQFENAAGGVIADIAQDTTSPVGIHISNCAISAPSDYRLKDDLGPVVGVRERVAALRPRHLSWKASGIDFDGFFAHEVEGVVPAAVWGVKDATNDDGTIAPQQLDAEALIPLLTAGLQLALDRLDELAAR